MNNSLKIAASLFLVVFVITAFFFVITSSPVVRPDQVEDYKEWRLTNR